MAQEWISHRRRDLQDQRFAENRPVWADAAEVTAWLDRHVGPFGLEPMGLAGA